MGRPGAGAGYRPELDGIRALAVVGVMLFHASGRLPFRLLGGAQGVDLFFVLSGLLITTLLLQEYDRTTTIDLPAFYFRRVLRLLPAFVVFLAGAALVADVVHSQRGLAFGPAAAVSFLNIGNWFQASERKLGILTHTWSLSIEWQFYVFWPLTLAVALKRRIALRRIAIAAALAAVAVAIARALVYRRFGTDPAMFWTFTRADGVLIGSALALALAGGGRVGTLLKRQEIGFVGALGAGIGLANFSVVNSTAFNGGLFFLVLCFAVVIGHVTVRTDGVAARILRTPGAPLLGRLSYAVYLFHVPVYLVFFHNRSHTGIGWVALAMLTTVALAGVSFVAVERPALRLKSRLRTWRAGRPPTVSAAAVQAPSPHPPASQHEAPTQG